MRHSGRRVTQAGFTIVEIALACFVFPIIIYGLSQAYTAVSNSYSMARQLNEIYSVLSACPEIDRALVYDSVSSTTNCFPNNTFQAEGGSSTLITYHPTLTVTNTSSLGSTDPLKSVPDSKVIDISVGFLHTTAPPLELRMLITRNGIGQQ